MGVSERFWEKVDKSGGEDSCWIWTGAIDTPRYGAFRYNGKKVNSHRMAWRLVNGEIPDGLLVCHKCDNRLCCNPSHMFLGTHLDNNRDMIAKGTFATGKRSGAWTHRNELLERARLHSRYAYAPEGQKWCSGHQCYESVSVFGQNRWQRDGLNKYCKAYRKQKRDGTLKTPAHNR